MIRRGRGINHNHTPYRSQFEPIPTLRETIDLCLQLKLRLFLDVKATDYRVVDTILQLYKAIPDLYRHVVVCSFHPEIIWQVDRVFNSIHSLIVQVKCGDSRIICGHTWRRWELTYSDADGIIPRS